MRRSGFLTALVVTGLLSILPAAADTPDGVFRVFGALASPTGDTSATFDFGTGPILATFEAESTFGLGLYYEVRVNDLFGVDTGIYFADFDFEARTLGSSGELGSAFAIPVTLGGNFHLVRGEQVDLYVGPLLAYTTWGNLEGPFGVSSTDSDFGVGGVIGADFRRRDSKWTFSTSLRYLSVAAGDSSFTIDVDPVFVEMGFGYRF